MLTHEQRILAQRSSLGQPHPSQKFRVTGGHAVVQVNPAIQFFGFVLMTRAVQHIYGMRK